MGCFHSILYVSLSLLALSSQHNPPPNNCIAYQALLYNEFHNNQHTWTPSTPSRFEVTPITGNDILSALNVETKLWYDFIILIGIIVVARLLAYFVLRYWRKPRG